MWFSISCYPSNTLSPALEVLHVSPHLQVPQFFHSRRCHLPDCQCDGQHFVVTGKVPDDPADEWTGSPSLIDQRCQCKQKRLEKGRQTSGSRVVVNSTGGVWIFWLSSAQGSYGRLTGALNSQLEVSHSVSLRYQCSGVVCVRMKSAANMNPTAINGHNHSHNKPDSGGSGSSNGSSSGLSKLGCALATQLQLTAAKTSGTLASLTHRLSRQPNGNGIIAMDAKLGGGLSTLPTIAVQKIPLNHMSQEEQDLIIGDQYPLTNGKANGHSHGHKQQESHRNGVNGHHVRANGKPNGCEANGDNRENNGLIVNKSHRLDPLGLKLPLSPNETLRYYGLRMNAYERSEVSHYPEVWYLGLEANKIDGDESALQNHGYDDDNGSYIK
ncbi:unnamed protein product [Oppiella nova]|uniref:Uncharacterized protein n=1 Tax=Oppiella nova TaxID=334625 RepID=A0A7R9LA31_9ACAR|nr:unnamed protein product [Oppiella nova]CAG2160847.1 unnamed protein product [Oppiella nova]